MKHPQDFHQINREPVLSIRRYERMLSSTPVAQPPIYTIGDWAASLPMRWVGNYPSNAQSQLPFVNRGFIPSGVESEYCGEDYN